MNSYFGAKIRIASYSGNVDATHLILFQTNLFSSEINQIDINKYLEQASEVTAAIEEEEFCRKFIEIFQTCEEVYFLKSHPEEVSSTVLEAIGLSFYQALMVKLENPAAKE